MEFFVWWWNPVTKTNTFCSAQEVCGCGQWQWLTKQDFPELLLNPRSTTIKTLCKCFYWAIAKSWSGALCHHWPCGLAGFPQENWPPPPQCDPSNPPTGRARPWLFAWSGTGWSSRSTTESSSRSQPTAGDRNKGNKGMNRLQEMMREFETDHQTPRQHMRISVFPLYCKDKGSTLKFNPAVQFLPRVKPVHNTNN